VEEINRYYHQYLDTWDKRWSPLLDVTVQEMCLFCNYSADEAWSEGQAERLLVDIRTVLHSLLGKHYEMRQILLYTEIYTL